MSSPSAIRKAVPEDEESIWELMELMHKENGAFEVSYPKVKWMLNRILYPQNIPPGDMGVRGYMGVIGPVGAIEALTILIIGGFWYTEQYILEELANFVHPDHRRGTHHAEVLLRYNQHLSDGLNIPLICGVLSNKRTEAKVRLYRRHFKDAEMAGVFFVHNIKFGTVNEDDEADDEAEEKEKG